jgi:RNA polymerase sigma factor (sigma-70 family)
MGAFRLDRYGSGRAFVPANGPVRLSSAAQLGALGSAPTLRSPLLRFSADEKLIALIRRGRDDAFEVLVERYRARLVAFCRNMLRSPEDAEDVFQEVLVNAYRAIHADSRPIAAKPWLYRIARNRCLNELRRNSADAVESMDVFEAGGPTAGETVERREHLAEVVTDVKRLPEQQRAALMLREMEGLPYQQIADVLETTVPSVKSLLVRARMGLAEAAEARSMSCTDAEQGVVSPDEARRRAGRRHVRYCGRCAATAA